MLETDCAGVKPPLALVLQLLGEKELCIRGNSNLSNSEDMADLREPTVAEIREAADLSAEVEVAVPDGITEVGLEELEPDLSEDLGARGPMEASDEAEPWFPPTDPVIVPEGNDAGGASVLGGLSPANDEEFREGGADLEDLVVPDDELRLSVFEALAADALTSQLRIEVLVADGVVTLRGAVDHLLDAESAESVAGRVLGVVEVREELRIESL